MHHKHKPPTGNFRWAVSFYGRLKAEAGTHSVRVITSANQIVIADMGVDTNVFFKRLIIYQAVVV